MDLNQTILSLHVLLRETQTDLAKSNKGNKLAMQRVRVKSIELKILFKEFRRLSILESKILKVKK